MTFNKSHCADYTLSLQHILCMGDDGFLNKAMIMLLTVITQVLITNNYDRLIQFLHE